ncbi:MAG: alpha-glucan family phosphorylase [Pseudomonadales bacterium]|nr:alpha-glucan family phosphorylase [Halioglobus sp.]MCP5123572.1 alpha-glucan family phosphorylase [Pseudomonadales bacterium]
MPGSQFPLEIQPRIPPELERLQEMANDLMYSWDRSIRSLFHRLDRAVWESCDHNPKAFLRRVSQHRLDEAVMDRSYMEDYRRVTSAYDAYREHRGRPELTSLFDPQDDLIAYFCLEFGFHESFPIYSGGLGILAGDHCKAASDVGLPFVAIGLLYQMGYFTQTIDGHGQQQVNHTRSHPHDLPVVPTLTETGQHLTLDIEFPGRILKVRVWTAQAGHITLYLLDTNLPENTPEDRAITHQLYGGDREMRLQQELVLGVGGVRALRTLGLRATVWHINEGHAAFQLLERCAFRMREGLDVYSAMELVAAGTVFTTHTPVPAGHDIFDRHLVEKYLGPAVRALGMDFEQVYQLGLNSGGGFNMTCLALRCTRFHNGVSRIHGSVAAEMEASLWPQIPFRENPITYITNGVHLQTFLAREWVSLFDLRFDDWRNELLNEEYWERLEEIPDYHYWSIHKALKQQLLESVHEGVLAQQRRNGTSDAVIHRMVRHVDGSHEDVLVMGFARRFATYKRAAMLFADPTRLARLLNDPARPVVIIFAGKAHPHDQPGQQLIRLIHDFSMHPDFIGKILLLEGYDMALARLMVSGVDVWLNTPEYPLEASGTSGQKAGLNGAVNLSVLDGWWGEGYNGHNGWGITPRDSRFDHEQRHLEEANDLLDIIEHEMLPIYFRRDGGGYSEDWVRLSKASMKSTIPRFNSERMLRDYVTRLYWPARQQRRKLEANNAEIARSLAAWKHRVRSAWPGVSMKLMLQPPAHLYQDDKICLRVLAELNGLQSTDVRLECLLGSNDADGEFAVSQKAELTVTGGEDSQTEFGIELVPEIAGLQYYKLRMYPYNEALSHPFELGFMIWI